MNRMDFLKELKRRGGYSELETPITPGLRKLEEDGFVTLAEYARCGFEMVRVDNVKLTPAGEMAVENYETQTPTA